MGDLNEWCKHDTLAAYCGDCMIELRAELAAVKHQRDGLVAALNESSGILEAFKFQSQTAMQQIEINEAALAKVKT